MGRSKQLLNVSAILFLMVCLIFGSTGVQVARANTTPLIVPYSWDWSDTSLLTNTGDWSGIQGVMGYQGTGLGNKITGVDPQTILVDGTNTAISLNPNQTDPNAVGGAGVTEFELADPSIGLSGSSSPHAPFLLMNLTTAGRRDITVEYDVRDLESSKQNAVQQVALHYRLGNTGIFTNVPQAYVADATDPNKATRVTHVAVALPETVDNQPLVQLRIMTANAVGRDEWVGIDNISIGSSYMPDDAATVSAVVPLPDTTGVLADSSLSVTFSEVVSLEDGWISLECSLTGSHGLSVTTNDQITFQVDPQLNFAQAESCQVRVNNLNVYDLDGLPPAQPVSDYSWAFTTADVPASPTMSLSAWNPMMFSGKALNFSLTLENLPADSPTIPHSRIKFIFANSLPGDISELAVYDPEMDAWIDLPLSITDGTTSAWLGPAEGFKVPGGYEASKLFKLRFNRPGRYGLTIQWYDLDSSPVAKMTELNQSANVSTTIFMPIISN